MQANRTRPGGKVAEPSYTLEGQGKLIDTGGTGLAFPLGSRVFHDKFGYGKVIGGEGQKLNVSFDKAGTKKVISTFVVAA